MPWEASRSSERDFADGLARRISDWVVEGLYRFGVMVLALAALAICVLGLTQSAGEGIRALIFFVIPSLWGAYALAVFDGQPDAFDKVMPQAVYWLAGLASLVIILVMVVGAPISIANLALGSMEAFFFVMRISVQPSRYQRRLDSNSRALAGALLLMLTVLCAALAVAV